MVAPFPSVLQCFLSFSGPLDKTHTYAKDAMSEGDKTPDVFTNGVCTAETGRAQRGANIGIGLLLCGLPVSVVNEPASSPRTSGFPIASIASIASIAV